MFNCLKKNENNYYFSSIKKFKKDESLSKENLKKCFEFAWDMTFGKKGEHRCYRSGGSTKRKKGEIFINAFQGKLAEFAVYESFYKNGIKLSEPDLDTYALGEWDDSDFSYKSNLISIKSTPYFGNLLLLETKDWDGNAFYKPNQKSYNYHILVRINPDGKGIMRKNRLFYSDDMDKRKLLSIIESEIWEFEVTGYITKDDLKKIISSDYILPKGAFLGEKTQMDAENYYVQSGDLKIIEDLFKKLNCDK